MNDDNKIVGFNEDKATKLFSVKVKMAGQTGNNNTKKVEIMVLLKYICNLYRILEMPLINCEINLNLHWSGNYVIVATNVAAQEKTDSAVRTDAYFDQGKLQIQKVKFIRNTLAKRNKSYINQWTNSSSTRREHCYLLLFIIVEF